MSQTPHIGPDLDPSSPDEERRGYIPAVAGAYPVRAGNLVRPLVDGEPAFRRIAEAIEAARHSIWLTVTFYAHDFQFADGRSLFDMLDDAVARGLDVRVLFGGRIQRAAVTDAPSQVQMTTANCSVPGLDSPFVGIERGQRTASTKSLGCSMPVILPRPCSSAV